MAANTTIQNPSSLPAQVTITLANGTWQEVALPVVEGFGCVMIKTSGNAYLAFDFDGVADAESVSGTAYPGIAASDMWFMVPIVSSGAQQSQSVFLAGNGGTPTVTVMAVACSP